MKILFIMSQYRVCERILPVVPKLEKDYEAIGYSTDEIEIQKHRFYSLPFLLSVMTIMATIIMKKSKLM